jgi:hypothetical protein
MATSFLKKQKKLHNMLCRKDDSFFGFYQSDLSWDPMHGVVPMKDPISDIRISLRISSPSFDTSTHIKLDGRVICRRVRDPNSMGLEPASCGALQCSSVITGYHWGKAPYPLIERHACFINLEGQFEMLFIGQNFQMKISKSCRVCRYRRCSYIGR